MFAERAAVWTGCQRVKGGGEWLRGRTGDGGDLRSCQKIWGWRIEGWLEGVFAEVKRVGGGWGGKGLGGNHWKQTKGVPGTQEVKQESSSSSSLHVQLLLLDFFFHHFIFHSLIHCLFCA